MGWRVIAKSHSSESIKERIKNFLRSHPYCHYMRGRYNIPMSYIDSKLDIEIKNLEGLFSQANGDKMIFDTKIASDPEFFSTGIHFILHEFNHWLARQSERRFYFNDLEEVDCFSHGIAWSLMQGNDIRTITNQMFPIVANHFDDKLLARKFFMRLVDRATRIAAEYASSEQSKQREI